VVMSPRPGRIVRELKVELPRPRVAAETFGHPEHVKLSREIRALLEFCGLPFEAACLEFHRTRRSVGSPSAMQVREPLKRDTARAQRYGAALDPLRRALGLAPFAEGAH